QATVKNDSQRDAQLRGKDASGSFTTPQRIVPTAQFEDWSDGGLRLSVTIGVVDPCIGPCNNEEEEC
ncbi:hypothetical protein SESBI_45365, partial [Sesbania bispinosa]